MSELNIPGRLTPEGRRLLEQLKKLKELEVVVGFQSGECEYPDGTDLCTIAAANEFGSCSTPSRPFMKQSFVNHEKDLRAACEVVNRQIVSGKTAEEALKTLGVFLKGLVQNEIRDGGFAPNAPSTIARKHSEQPLIDTGHMRQSVNYVVRKAGSNK